MLRTPFKHHVPKDPKKNLEWRRKIAAAVRDDPEFCEVIKEACKRDPIFFVNAFAWTYDPRPAAQKILGFAQSKVPFILYGFQEEALLELLGAIEGGHDILVEKSRDMGASWLCVTAFHYRWLFRPLQSFLFVSRVEDYVDSSGNPKALFWKLDYLNTNLPQYLLPVGFNLQSHRRKLHIENPENGSVIDGESTTGRVARGDRRTAILLDEFAAVEQGESVLKATRDATDCRVFNSTPEGTNNAFYKMRQTKIRKLRLHWSVHPRKAIGLYTTTEHGDLKVLDPDGFPEDHKPILDDKLRSPWYDRECERCASPYEIAQELDIDYLGSGHQFFNPDKVHEAVTLHALPPSMVGELVYDEATGDPIEFRDDPKGTVRLWVGLDGKNQPICRDRLVVGSDVSAGTGASNSVLAGYSAKTKEKVFEFTSPYHRPEAFATLTVALLRWFQKASLHSPFLLWESNGPGRQYGSRVLDLGYGNIYLRKNDASIKQKVSDVPGWPPTKESKMVLLGNYRSGVEGLRCCNRSKRALEETLEYVFTPNGGVAHARAADKSDPSGANANHGDRVMADALAWKGLGERKRTPQRETPQAPPGSLAWRRKMREQAARPVNQELGEGW
jgi:hypothetical protein